MPTSGRMQRQQKLYYLMSSLTPSFGSQNHSKLSDHHTPSAQNSRVYPHTCYQPSLLQSCDEGNSRQEAIVFCSFVHPSVNCGRKNFDLDYFSLEESLTSVLWKLQKEEGKRNLQMRKVIIYLALNLYLQNMYEQSRRTQEGLGRLVQQQQEQI